MYHSITFGDKNTWDDWHLIPSSRPVFNPPKLKTKYIEVPGSNVVIDLTDIMGGCPTYQYREGSIEFYVQNGYGEWQERYSGIMNYLHGKHLRATLEDDPTYVYEGRFTVNKWSSDKIASKITIDYYVEPYKKETISTIDDFIWDTFSFEIGIIREYGDITVAGSKSLRIIGSEMPVIPSVKSTGNVSLTIDGKTYTINEGITKLYDLVLLNKVYDAVISGNATVSIIFTGGSL